MRHFLLWKKRHCLKKKKESFNMCKVASIGAEIGSAGGFPTVAKCLLTWVHLIEVHRYNKQVQVDVFDYFFLFNTEG